MQATVTNELEAFYQARCETATDINEHLPLLRKMAGECWHVTELGTRAGSSTVALLAGLLDGCGPTPGMHKLLETPKLVCYDLARWGVVDLFERWARPGQFKFHQADISLVVIEETDLLFIDTFHSYWQLRCELKFHAGKARKWIVLHDTESYGVTGEDGGPYGLGDALKEFLERGTFRIVLHRRNNNGLTVLERIAPEEQGKDIWPDGNANVYLGIPFYQYLVGQAVPNYDNAVSAATGNCYSKWWEGGAAHCRNFNVLWCGALNSRAYGWTHFAMVHADVQVRGAWIDVMLKEMEAHQADVLCVASPIKTQAGLTSLAFKRRSDGVVRRVTMKELYAEGLPMTFDGPTAMKALGWEGEWDMLIGSSLWICRFTEDWVDKVWFSDANRIVRGPDGFCRAEWVSEDWFFSSQLHSLGLKIVATKAGDLHHWGLADFPNTFPWGTTEHDPEATPYSDWYDWPVACDYPAQHVDGNAR